MESGPPYRQELAKSLQEAPKEERPALLRNAKRTHEYGNELTDHQFQRKNEERDSKLEGILKRSETLTDLCSALEGSEILVKNNVAGQDHGEHLVKQIEMARKLGSTNFLSERGGFKEKVSFLLEKEGVELNQIVTPEKYKHFLLEGFPGMNLSDQELDRVSTKLRPEVFASIDGEMEYSVVELNALADTETRFSCAGHPEQEDDQGIYSYLAFKTADSALAHHIQKLEKSTLTGQTKVSSKNGEVQTIHFSIKVPREWIEKNKKKTSEQLFDERKKLLAEILGPEILSYPFDRFRKDEGHFINELVRLQDVYIETHKESSTIPMAHNSYFLKNIDDALSGPTEYNEWADYYSSEEAQHERKNFLRDLKNAISEYRAQKSKEGQAGSRHFAEANYL
jgi:hypothetical protein